VKIALRHLAVLLFAVAGTASADQFTWGNTYAQAWQGFGTSPYSAINTATQQTITIFCLDYNDEIAPPFTWNANVWALNQQNVQSSAQYGGNYNNLLNTAYQTTHPGQTAPHQISGTPFAFMTDSSGGYSVNLSSSPDPYSRYLEAAWLFTELEDAGGQSQMGLVAQVAAWELFVNSSNIQDLHTRIVNTGGTSYGFQDYVDSPASALGTIASGLNFEQAVDYALFAAQRAVVTDQSFTGTGWSIVTASPTWVESSAGQTIPAQEFLSPNAVPPVPEPGSLLLLATVAGAAYWAKRRRAA
jgi:hypothetical protein